MIWNDGVDDDTIGLTMVVRMNSVKIKLLPLIVWSTPDFHFFRAQVIFCAASTQVGTREPSTPYKSATTKMMMGMAMMASMRVYQEMGSDEDGLWGVDGTLRSIFCGHIWTRIRFDSLGLDFGLTIEIYYRLDCNWPSSVQQSTINARYDFKDHCIVFTMLRAIESVIRWVPQKFQK